MTIINSLKSILESTTLTLHNLDNSRLEAELLLAYVLKQPRSYLYAHPEEVLSPQQLQLLTSYLQQRVNGKPIAYILGEKEFWSLPLIVNEHTLIPRPDTELLVEQVLKIIPKTAQKTVVDLGTGSGAIALAIAHERPNCRVLATDQSAQALQVAQLNAERLGVHNVEFYQGDWCAALPTKLYNIIVSNPPYIPEHDPHLQQGDLQFEPQSALIAGKDGLNAYRTIVAQAKDYLLPGGYLFFEHGYNQGEAVRALLQQYKFIHITTMIDLAQHERVTFGRM